MLCQFLLHSKAVQLYITYSFSYSFPAMVHHRILNIQFPVLYSRTFLFIHPVIIVYICYPQTGFPGGSMTKNPPAMQEMWVQSRGQEELATHSSILTWEILWTEEPERLQSIRLQSQTQLSTQTPQPSNLSILPTPSSNKG